MNVYNTDKSRLSPQELAMSSNTIIRQKYRKEFTLEFSRDRKSMSTYVSTANKSGSGNQTVGKMFVKGAPESVVERCTHIRVGTQKVPMTAALKQEIMKLVHQYGTGRDTLRCLALGTIDSPMRREDMDLEDARKFITYEVKFQNYAKNIVKLINFIYFRTTLHLSVLSVCLIHHVRKLLMLSLVVVMLVFVSL